MYRSNGHRTTSPNTVLVFMLLLCGFFNPSVTGGDVAQTMTYVLIDRDFVRIGNQFLEFIITLGNNTG
ncbi:MAG: hypothetical protein ACP5HX_11825, partial [Thermoproteota archaeon]